MPVETKAIMKPDSENASAGPGFDQADFFADVGALLAGSLEQAVGLENASSFVAMVGEQIGERIAAHYKREGGGELPDDPLALGDILVDLKARIGGAFRIESADENQIVLINTRCPFAERAEGRPSLCMMTTTVFGRIVAEANGYSRVVIDEALSTGQSQCRVRVKLVDDRSSDGYEFFR